MRALILTSLLLAGQSTDAEPFNSAQPVEIAVRKAALKYGIDADLYIAILQHESRLQLDAYNAATRDYGIAQINYFTIRAYKLDRSRLRTDLQYSVNAGARVLAEFQHRYKGREPATWVCRYNLGSRPIKGRRAELCTAYLNKVYKHAPDRGIAGGFNNGR